MGTAAERPSLSSRDDLVTALLGVWLLLGGLLDASAHQRGEIETFFSRSHAVLYSGFGATAGWVLWRVRARSRSRGYELGLVGIAIFAIGGVGDLIWHSVFGIERGLAGVTSPSHVLLFVGALLLLSTPLRAAWSEVASRRGVGLLSVWLSVTSVTTLTALILYFVSPFLFRDIERQPSTHAVFDPTWPVIPEGLGASDLQRAGISAFILSTLVLFAPVILLVRRWRIPVGFFTLMIGSVVTALLAMVRSFEPYLLAGAWAGGLAVDALNLALLAGGKRQARLRLFGALAPAAFWGIYVVSAVASPGVRWETELWAGAIVWSALAGLGVAMLVTLRVPEAADARA